MSSEAHAYWSTERAARIDELVQAARALRGSRRRYAAVQLERSMVAALVGEFQGFARDLHDAAVRRIVEQTREWNPKFAPTLWTALTSRRELDRRTPTMQTLVPDFATLGLNLLPTLQRADPTLSKRLPEIGKLIELRNAIVHGDDQRLAELSRTGTSLSIRVLARYRATLERLADTMDRAMGERLEDVFGPAAGW